MSAFFQQKHYSRNGKTLFIQSMVAETICEDSHLNSDEMTYLLPYQQPTVSKGLGPI
jgi:hypothetical protein